MADVPAEYTDEISGDESVFLCAEKTGQTQRAEGQRIVKQNLKGRINIGACDKLQDSVCNACNQSGSNPVNVSDQTDK